MWDGDVDLGGGAGRIGSQDLQRGGRRPRLPVEADDALVPNYCCNCRRDCTQYAGASATDFCREGLRGERVDERWWVVGTPRQAGDVGLRCAYISTAGDLRDWPGAMERWKSCMLQGATQQIAHLTGHPNCLANYHILCSPHHKSHLQRLGTRGA